MSERTALDAADRQWKSVDAIRASVPGGQNPLLRQGISPGDWLDRPIPPRRWVVDGLIPVGGVTLLYGDGALGKSLLAMQLQAACAIGTTWLGQVTMQCPSVGFYTEDDADEIHRRGADIYRHYGVALNDPSLQSVKYFDRVGLENNLIDFGKIFDRDTGVTKNLWQETRLFRDIMDLAIQRQARLVILDALADLYSGNENEKATVRYFMGQLRNIASEIDGAVLLLAHPSVAGMASGSGTSGNTAWNNSARSRLYLTRPKSDEEIDSDPDLRILSTMKSNYGRIGKRVDIRWDDGVFVTEQSEGMVASLVRDNQVSAVLEGLQTLAKQTRSSSAAPNVSNYAPKLLKDLPVCKGIGISSLKRIVSDLMAAGEISRQKVGIGPDRHAVYGLLPTPKTSSGTLL